MRNSVFLLILLSLFLKNQVSYAMLKMDSNQNIFFELTDPIKDKRFAWSRTLLSYPVDFNGAKVSVNNLILKEVNSGEMLPFQLSDIEEINGTIKTATLNFFSDLPSAASYKFELSVQNAKKINVKNKVQVLKNGDYYEINGGQLKVRIPASHTFGVNECVPGPITQLCRNEKWVGQSQVKSPKQAIKSLTVELKEQGDLFVSALLIYRFERGGEYRATVKVVADCDYIEFEESMINLNKDEGVHVDFIWKGLDVTHRSNSSEYGSSTQRIDENIVLTHRGEDPAFTGPARTENIAEDFIYTLCPHMFGDRLTYRAVSFSNELTNEAIGLFVKDAYKWTVPEYAIWNYSMTNRIHFRYSNHQLSWIFPLATGSRSTALLLCDKKDTEEQSMGKSLVYGKEVEHTSSKFNLIRNRSSELSLNRIKDYHLIYSGRSIIPNIDDKNIFFLEAIQSQEADKMKSPQEYLEKFWNDGMVNIWKGVIHPVSNRSIPHWIVPGYIRFQSQFTSEERNKVNAMLLLLTYVVAGEEVAPIKTMLGGHPNFMADWLFPLAGAAFLFPDHPEAEEWSNQYSKFVELTGLYYSRPDVKTWNSRGGRWTESLGVYNFAYLLPTAQGNQLLTLRNGENVFANELLAQHAKYLIGVTTAPVLLKGKETMQSIHPPQGAHSAKRAIPGSVYGLGEWLKNYDPLTAEYLMRIGSPSANMKKEFINKGTRPGLKSAKFTGYGIVMRAGVDTPEEMSVFLQQIDKGPNYRWGYANEGGSGNIYYYATGKSYSGHLREDAGDRRAQDAMFSCNTGVYKDKNFMSIGMNDLTAPFYNLDAVQYAELLPRKGKDNYSAPEYKYRSVLLVGTDYIVIYDAVTENANTRFAWSIGPDDTMPEISVIKGGSAWPTEYITREGNVESRGIQFQSHPHGGDRMTLVTHRKDVSYQKPGKRENGGPYEVIHTANSTDYLFNSQFANSYAVDGFSFTGRVGMVRKLKDGYFQMALIKGSSIMAGQVEVTSDNEVSGISLHFKTPEEIEGKTYTETPAILTFDFKMGIPVKSALYLDGELVKVKKAGNQLSFVLPIGEHSILFTKGDPRPVAPKILYTINGNSTATIFYNTVPAANLYLAEVSLDGGATWNLRASSKSNSITLKNLTNGTKIHARIIAANNFQNSLPSGDYPIYVTHEVPSPPEGLYTNIRGDYPIITWGEVLGVSSYKLYRKIKGEKSFKIIFHGRTNRFVDNQVFLKKDSTSIYEYAVTAINGNGESKHSLTRNTDNCSWKNWTPNVGYKFNRQSTYWLPPYVEKEAIPPMYYPE